MASIRLASWNIRYNNKPSPGPVSETLKWYPSPLVQPRYQAGLSSEQPWRNRRVKVAQQILAEDVAIIGIQEALIRQVEDLKELLNGDPETSDWEYVGVGREDGSKRGEFNPIFYRKSLVRIESWDTFWLSDTPFKPSKHRDAGCPRICTTANFIHKSPYGSDWHFSVLNTHLDHHTDVPRQQGASLVLWRAQHEGQVRDDNCPVFVMGDFNSSTSGNNNSGAYKIMTGESAPLPINDAFKLRFPHTTTQSQPQTQMRMRDVLACTPLLGVSGGFATFTNFASPSEVKDWQRIDFIFGGGHGWKCKRYKVVSAHHDDGITSSDHRLILASISFG